MSCKPLEKAPQAPEYATYLCGASFDLHHSQNQGNTFQDIVQRLQNSSLRRFTAAASTLSSRNWHMMSQQPRSLTMKQVTPDSLKTTVLKLCHDVPTTGYLVRDKTVAKLSEGYWRREFRADVYRYVTCVNHIK